MEFINAIWVGKFEAMASPCEVIVDCDDALLANHILQIVRNEVLRIEKKFSRYRSDNIVYQINHQSGKMTLDEESARLLDYAEKCYDLSGGLFDITSGVLREVWTFDGGESVPSHAEVAGILANVGWSRVVWKSPELTLPEKMEIDFGGIGKEYAVDKAVSLVRAYTETPCMINLGGDVAVTSSRRQDQAWVVGIEDAKNPSRAKSIYRLKYGAIATSGDARRFVMRDGKRYSHILNPKTGWPIDAAPSSVTVLAGNCAQAGMFATFAMLQGANAESFLQDEKVQYQIQWSNEVALEQKLITN